MSKKEQERYTYLWNGINEDDFANEINIDDTDLAGYDKEKMTIFSANINFSRQLLRLSDSLTPVKRRILYTMYLQKSFPNTRSEKMLQTVGGVSKWHAHGDGSIYKTIVGMSQPFKTNVPLISGKGNFGNDEDPDIYAHSRYTEGTMSQYAYECFFEDYDPDCVETIFNTSKDEMEPVSLPSKFPNIFVNGGVGIAVGNSFVIPPYNIEDIVKLCKKLIDNPDAGDIYMIPDLPTGCDIVDDGSSLRSICDTGTGILRMRAIIEISEEPKNWVLTVKKIPWLSSLASINEKLVKITKDGVLPIKDIHDCSYTVQNKYGMIRKMIDYRIIIDKNHDPYAIKRKLYKLTELEKTMAVNFKVVMNGLKIEKLNLRNLILAWIDERREYKRRLLNKKIQKISSRLSLVDILIYLTESDNLEKTIRIIRNNNLEELNDALHKANMSTYQAGHIIDMKLGTFSKDAHQRFIDEKARLTIEMQRIMTLVKSSKKIDEIILDELDDLKKYGSPRRSAVITEDEEIIPNTDHILIITKQGYIKKFLYDPQKKMTTYGAFKNLDYPTGRLTMNNLDSVIFFDSLGKYSCIPVHDIKNTDMTGYGNLIYDFTKMSGEIVTMQPAMNQDTEDYIHEKLNEKPNILTLSKNGYIKKTELKEYNKNSHNVRACKLKSGDSLVYANIVFDSSDILLYTQKGFYAFIKATDVPVLEKDSVGIRGINLDDTDACVGCTVIGKNDPYLIIVTEKGCIKKCERQYLGEAGKRRLSSYLTSLDDNDKVIFVDSATENSTLTVCTRTSYEEYQVGDIPVLTRKAKCKKMIAVPLGSNIIAVSVSRPKK